MKNLPSELMEILNKLCVDPKEIRSVHSSGNANLPWVLRTTDPENPWAVAGRAYQTFADFAAVQQYLGEQQKPADDLYELVPLFGEDPKQLSVAGGVISFVGKLGGTVFCTATPEFLASSSEEQVRQAMAMALREAGCGDVFGALLPPGIKFFRLKAVGR